MGNKTSSTQDSVSAEEDDRLFHPRKRRPSDLSLQTLLEEPVVSRAFRKFMLSKLSEELLMLWADLIAFELIPYEARTKKIRAQDIFTKFFAKDSHTPSVKTTYMDPDTVEILSRKLQVDKNGTIHQSDSHVLAEAFKFIFGKVITIIKFEYMPQFLASEFFTELHNDFDTHTPERRLGSEGATSPKDEYASQTRTPTKIPIESLQLDEAYINSENRETRADSVDQLSPQQVDAAFDLFSRIASEYAKAADDNENQNCSNLLSKQSDDGAKGNNSNNNSNNNSDNVPLVLNGEASVCMAEPECPEAQLSEPDCSRTEDSTAPAGNGSNKSTDHSSQEDGDPTWSGVPLGSFESDSFADLDAEAVLQDSVMNAFFSMFVHSEDIDEAINAIVDTSPILLGSSRMSLKRLRTFGAMPMRLVRTGSYSGLGSPNWPSRLASGNQAPVTPSQAFPGTPTSLSTSNIKSTNRGSQSSSNSGSSGSSSSSSSPNRNSFRD
mmetsp:Transcript_9976/g.17493  ORF Transcript_9976/g.17493 Transcript_9976/m.17493 type:complete len:494 (+) Transcript_9976:443-1924(+)